jgi:competence protein ComGF
MKDILRDWRRWSAAERLAAIALIAAISLVAPVAFALEAAAG